MVALLAARALAAEIAVPAELDPLGWARAWSEVVDAMQDPALDDTRVTWTRPDGRWVLTLENGQRQVTVDGLAPASDNAGRLEQLYVALGLLGQRSREGRKALASRLAVPPRPPPPAEPPNPPAPPPPEPEVPVVVRSDPPPPPPPPQPETIVQFSVVDTERQDGPLVTALGSLDTQGAVALGVQVDRLLGPLALGARSGVRHDPDVLPGFANADVELKSVALSMAAVVDLLARRWGLVIGASFGAEHRWFSGPDEDIGRGWVPEVGVRIGYVAPGRPGLRVEIGLTHDLRAQGFARGVLPPTFLPADRVTVTFGLSPRSHR